MAIQSSLLLNTTSAISPSLSSDIAVTTLIFCNLNTPDPADISIGRQYIDVHVVESASLPTNTNKIINQLPIDAGDTFSFSTERIVLGQGDRIYSQTTDNNQVSVTISYVTL
jgi:hypothetical protein